MPPSDTPPGFFQRARTWLMEKERMRAKLLCCLAGDAGGMLLVLALVFPTLRNAYQETTRTGAGFGGICWLAGYWLVALASLTVLAAATWYTFRIYRRHIQRVEEAESRGRFIVDACPDAILVVDSQGIVESCNKAAETIFGYKHGEIPGKKVSKLIPQRHFLHDVATKGQTGFIAYAERRNAVRFPVEIAVSEAEHEGRRRFIILVHDASERRYSDENVHHISLSVSSSIEAEYVRTLVLQLSQALQNDCAFIAEIGTDPAICTLTLAEHGRLSSKTNFPLAGTVFGAALQDSFTAIPHGLREKYRKDPLLESLKAESFIATPLVDHRERTVGLIGVMHCTAATQIGIARQTLQIFAARAAAEIERKQEFEGLALEKDRLTDDMTAIRDTAERERTRYEDEIAAEQELLAVTLRSIREGCITTDNDARVVTLNPVAEQLTGWTQQEAADHPLSEVLRLTSIRGKRPLDISRLSEKIRQGDSQSLVIARDGTQRRVELSAAPIRARKNLKLGTVLVLRDVTEKHFLEEERYKAEKLESIGVAAGGIAHDFNNLLTAVIGNLSLSLMENEVHMKDRIEASKNAALRAQDLARQLLTFAKGGAPVKCTSSLNQLVCETIGFTLSGTNIRSAIDLPENLWPGDVNPGQISQVMSNLAVNAVQAMEQGGTLHVSGENLVLDAENAPPTLEPGRYVRITVRDEGPGIAEEIRKKIFDPYFTTKPTGNGLGLATSYSIVKNHNGYISVDSLPGEGATFRVYLPASEGEIAPEVKHTPPKAGRGGKVLVLDDEEVICELISYSLTAQGYQVVESREGNAALRLYKQALEAGEPFDLVIMDLTIPGGMGGREALQELMKMDPGARAIVASGYATDPIMLHYKEYGFCGSIAKPFDLVHLAQAVQEAISS
ncbi:MAG: PAS domain S-box protein [Verrucomicrobia bacterium]|nr:PAS domain S-box protein [Verrucomicrobiota bacterium]